MNRLIILIITAFLMSNFAYSQTSYKADLSKIPIEKDGAVLLPVEKFKGDLNLYSSIELQSSKAWDEFRKEYGTWTIMFDKLTKTPRRAFGNPIQINGFNEINKENIEEASLAFLNKFANLFNINTNELKIKNVSQVKNKWYVKFSQIHNGIELLLSEVDLRISDDGKVFSFGVDFFNNIDVDLTPTISSAIAVDNAHFGLNFNSKNDKIQANEKMYILPVKTNSGISFKLTYNVKFETNEPYGVYSSYVDSHSGMIVWRINQTKQFGDFKTNTKANNLKNYIKLESDYIQSTLVGNTSITVKGLVKPVHPWDEQISLPFSNIYVNIGGQVYATDENGKVEFDITEQTSYSVKFNGPNGHIANNDADSIDAEISGVINPGENLTLEWNDSNSKIQERILFYHTDVVYKNIKRIDPEMTVMDYSTEVLLSYDSWSPNAMATGESIYFIGISYPGYRFPETPTVLYHEYTHNINARLYQQLGSDEGMINLDCNEGTADLGAALIVKDPRMGVGYLTEDTTSYLRNLVNDYVYPDDLESDSHFNGQILSGSYWDLIDKTSLEYVEHISHFAKYGTPDDADVGIAFAEWFIETLIADDDDNNLSNGTPNDMAIIESFNNHQIGTDLFVAVSFSHDNLPDSEDTLNAFTVPFTMASKIAIMEKPVENIEMVYSTDGFVTFQTVAATETAANQFSAEIPAQKKGTLVQYYFKAVDPFTKKTLVLSSKLGEIAPFEFLVGYIQAFYDNFEKDNGWTTSTTTDDATSGVWERDTPTEVNTGSLGIMQPGSGCSAVGSKCYVTGAKSGQTTEFYANMPNGKTTLTSPVFDISNLENPLIKFKYWFFNYYLDNDYKPQYVVQISSNAGENWVNVTSVIEGESAWKKIQFNIGSLVSLTPNFQIRIVFDAVHYSGFQAFYFSEALMDEFEILTTNHTIINSVDDEINTNNGVLSFPNPFASNITISTYIDKPQRVVAQIFNIYGELVSTINDSYLETGNYSFNWNGTNSNNQKVATGTYFVKILMNNQLKTEKIIMN